MEITVSMSLEDYNKAIENAKRDGINVMLDHIEAWRKSGMDARSYANHIAPAIPSPHIIKFFNIMNMYWEK